jgi:hypothetical protein
MVIKSKTMRWEGHVAHLRGKRHIYRCLVETAEGNTSLLRHRPIWECNIKVNYKEKDMRAWIGFIWLRIGASSRLF